MNVDKRIFVVGCPRSGTTLLQTHLMAHPDIHSFPETHFFPRIIPCGLRRHIGLASSDADEWFLRLLGNVDLDQEFKQGVIPRLFIRQYTRAFLRVLDRATVKRQATTWVEKTPRHLHYIDEIEWYLPNPHFVHIIRNGEDVVASLYDVTHKYPEEWGGERSINTCLDRWRKDVNITRNHVGRPRHHLVRYERLVEDRALVLSELCGEIDVSFHPDMLRERKRKAENVINDEPWKSRAHRAVGKPAQRKFHRIFSNEEKSRVSEGVSSINLSNMDCNL